MTLGPLASTPGLVDEYVLPVSPIVLAAGPRLFDAVTTDIVLNLVTAKSFDGGSGRAALPERVMNDARSQAATTFTWSYLDMTALGRQEEWEDSPPGYPQTSPYDWWIWHDNLQTETSPQRSALLPGQQPTFTPVASEPARGDDRP